MSGATQNSEYPSGEIDSFYGVSRIRKEKQGAQVILFFPGSDSDAQFEIHATEDIEIFGELSKGQLILLKIYENIKCYCYVVDIFESRAETLRHYLEATLKFLKIFEGHLQREERKAMHVLGSQNVEDSKNLIGFGLYSSCKMNLRTSCPDPYDDYFEKVESSQKQGTTNELSRSSVSISRHSTSESSYTKSTTLENTDHSDDQDENIIIRNGLVKFGRGPTLIRKVDYDKIVWNKLRYTLALRRLLRAAFSPDVLAKHSLSGKPSPAFVGRNKETKPQLDPIKVNDIIVLVARKYEISESLVRAAVTTALADARKLGKKKIFQNN